MLHHGPCPQHDAGPDGELPHGRHGLRERPGGEGRHRRPQGRGAGAGHDRQHLLLPVHVLRGAGAHRQRGEGAAGAGHREGGHDAECRPVAAQRRGEDVGGLPAHRPQERPLDVREQAPLGHPRRRGGRHGVERGAQAHLRPQSVHLRRFFPLGRLSRRVLCGLPKVHVPGRACHYGRRPPLLHRLLYPPAAPPGGLRRDLPEALPDHADAGLLRRLRQDRATHKAGHRDPQLRGLVQHHDNGGVRAVRPPCVGLHHAEDALPQGAGPRAGQERNLEDVA
mmetsp:Transcript_88199/g.249939  ORF Transcript_88199/g.249939 Transcript_88199/m.249939 type:complete len:280 (+) Transcript_88199:1060-1899(+)